MHSRQLVFKTSWFGGSKGGSKGGWMCESVARWVGFRGNFSAFVAASAAVCFLCFSILGGSNNESLLAQQQVFSNLGVMQAPTALPQIAQPATVHPNSVPGAIVSGQIPVATPSAVRETGVGGELAPAMSPAESAQIADEINSIRRQLGGGLSKHFEQMTKVDPAWKETLEESFQNEINRLANGRVANDRGDQSVGQQREVVRSSFNPDTSGRLAPPVLLSTGTRPTEFSSSNPVPGIPPAQFPFQPNRPTLNTWTPSQVVPVPPLLNQVEASPTHIARRRLGMVPSQNPAEQLRSAAKALDAMAGEFETTGLYEEADQVRAQAQKLWLKSRQFQFPEVQ